MITKAPLINVENVERKTEDIADEKIVFLDIRAQHVKPTAQWDSATMKITLSTGILSQFVLLGKATDHVNMEINVDINILIM